MGNFGNCIEQYQVLEVLGKGGFAMVYRAKCLQSGEDVAIKMIDKKLMRSGGMINRVKQEVGIHSRLKHPSVLELFTFFEDAKYVYLVLELCENGELQRYIKSNKYILNEEEASTIIKQVVEGLLYLHSHQIVHRDVTLANLLLTKELSIKIADFGLATQLSRPDEKHMTMCGTPNYISPEIVTRAPHGLETDLWGLGVLLFALLTGKPPFDNNTGVKSTLTRVVMSQVAYPSSLSLQARDLLSSLLKKNPSERIKLHQILEHPFMNRRNFNSPSFDEEDSSVGGKRPWLSNDSGVASSYMTCTISSGQSSLAPHRKKSLSPVRRTSSQLSLPQQQQHHHHHHNNPHSCCTIPSSNNSHPPPLPFVHEPLHPPYSGPGRPPSQNCMSAPPRPLPSIQYSESLGIGGGGCNSTNCSSIHSSHYDNCMFQASSTNSFAPTLNNNNHHGSIGGEISHHLEHSKQFQHGHNSYAGGGGGGGGGSYSNYHLGVQGEDRSHTTRSSHHHSTSEPILKAPSQVPIPSNTNLCPPINSKRLTPVRQKTKNVILNIMEGGDVCLEFIKFEGGVEKVWEVLRISMDGMRIVVYRPRKGMEVSSELPKLVQEGADFIYSYESLPEKYWKKYAYASKFVELVKSKTPKITYYSTEAKCCLMENGPDRDFEVTFYHGGKMTKSKNQIKLTEPPGNTYSLEMTESIPNGLSSVGGEMWKHFIKCLSHCQLIETTFKSLSEGVEETCFPITVGRRPKPPPLPSSNVNTVPSSSKILQNHSSNKENCFPHYYSRR